MDSSDIGLQQRHAQDGGGRLMAEHIALVAGPLETDRGCDAGQTVLLTEYLRPHRAGLAGQEVDAAADGNQ
ncbi:hypothetical protein [Gordonia neofelifaecis]|uniref:hypothetical protein n=1 Tax=Gordonia neofelifaecis TaxID=945692 RepID=UPI001EE67E33|nr:hypothetical protein [Gordonia neofelifaecis]